MHLAPRPRPTSRSGPRRSRLAATLTSALLTVGLLVGAAPGPGGHPARAADGKPSGTARQADDSLPFATNNMEGSNGGIRWTGEVGPLTEHHEVIALQEVGSGPPTEARGTQSESIPIPPDVTRPAGLPRFVNHSQWQYGRRSANPPRHVYYLQTDPRHSRETGQDRWVGGRVNLAVVTHEPATEVRVIENPLYNPSETNNAYRFRRALGVRIGDTFYYNVHARGSDVGGLLQGIRDATRPGERWVMFGDFNLDIRNRTDEEARNRSLHLRDDELLVRPNRATHQNGSEIDYAITHGLGRHNADIPSGRGPDHYPVQFEPAPTPVPAAPDGEAHAFSSALENAGTGWVMNASTDGRVTTTADRYNDRQRFRMETVRGHWYRFRVGQSPDGASGARAATAASGARGAAAASGARGAAAASGARGAAAQEAAPTGCPGLSPWLQLVVTLRSCDAPEAQWHSEDLGAPDGALRWHNSANPALCLTGAGQGDAVLAMPCGDSRRQQWVDSSRAVPDSVWETGESRVRLRASNGLYLAAKDDATGDDTPLTVHGRDQSERWDIEYAGEGDNIARLKGEDSGKCADVLDSEDAGEGTAAVLGDCGTGNSVNDGTGRRWVAETYGDGTLRLRNTATGLCMVPPLKEAHYVTVRGCDDEARQRWTVEQ
ncbi:ricin-type beta-trefoil lectin domain protein [Streptomyces lichenis]|uniref:Ricin-type beta-trefoil lectin domain protein n=1 Tax=Streptomyces lichenis TaxID=2306967 RepID=A0ABT0I766_9ACTN|nr:ricin-type beta-trefoil lectin domain protein [Streptomyces lichenis]MCK8677173.1 ricin-type beta-trefoil lectin domain protein [Streptomyces lichenis]